MRVRYRFTIRRLLLLSTAIAVCLATARNLGVPPWMKVALAVYSSFLAAWVIMRWPVWNEKQREIHQRRLELAEHRRAIAADVEERRAAARARAEGADDQ